MKEKVAIAMSGGVDSSVAAGLLVQQGYDVVGVMLKLWSADGQEECNRCCAPESMLMARRIAARLEIPFYVIDAKEIFYRQVVEDFIQSYQNGLTPNPCVRCNRYVRWDYLLQTILGMGCNRMATGHYARLERSDEGNVILLEGLDANKDQSYVLSMLNQDQLSRTIFPVGTFQKAEVRRMAEEMHLPVADKPDSQDLCFLGEQDYRTFLRDYGDGENLPGDIVTADGKIIGKHSGLREYTIGQRKGMRIANIEPYYVIQKDNLNNQLIVGPQSALGSFQFIAKQANWISGEPFAKEFEAEVKIRYKSPKIPGWIEIGEDGVFQFSTKQLMRDVTPGQISAVYKNSICLGAGIIQSTTPRD